MSPIQGLPALETGAPSLWVPCGAGLDLGADWSLLLPPAHLPADPFPLSPASGLPLSEAGGAQERPTGVSGVCVHFPGLDPAGNAHVGFSPPICHQDGEGQGWTVTAQGRELLGTRLLRGCHGAGAVGLLSCLVSLSTCFWGGGHTVVAGPGCLGWWLRDRPCAVGQVQTRDVMGPRHVPLALASRSGRIFLVF